MFNLQAHLNQIHQQFPPAQTKPVIGITANYEDQKSTLASTYYDSVIKAGGVPVIIPPTPDQHVIINTLQHIDALILSGGGDINPLWCDEDPIPELHSINQQRDLPELLITRLAYNRQIPILGICRGIQTLAVALGGKVAQHISTNIKHSQDADRTEPTHYVTIEEDSTLYNIYKEHMLPLQSEGAGGRLLVNSFHHQAVSEAGSRFRVVARANDGIVEAIESTEYKSIIGVQWHPECLDASLPLFQWLVNEAKDYRYAQNLHNHILTLDTHCDTPMLFHKGIDFCQRDSQACVDLHKMTEGRLDATIMVAYLPQPKIGETFSSLVSSPVPSSSTQLEGQRGTSPKQYADLIFDKIEQIVGDNPDYIALAKTPGDLYHNKRNQRKSIMLGIENALALEHDIKNVEHFAQRGVVYITLCHNGDNDVCDSAKGCNTNNGVSSFGQQVIAEMNKHGIIVDLSHANQKSFYDALDISKDPIVCSHSSCRALCDHPRNLTDDQMRQLAEKNGVMQITLYNGFLKQDTQATIIDAIDHLRHAISIMGIEHVGLGTDFDGDGGICGLSNASELIQFTRQLLKQHFTEQDIQMIWGGNFLHLMSQVQK